MTTITALTDLQQMNLEIFRMVQNDTAAAEKAISFVAGNQLNYELLKDMLQKVDDEDIQSICFVAVTHDGDIVHGRSVETDYHSILGGLHRQSYVVNQLLDQVNVNSSEQEY